MRHMLNKVVVYVCLTFQSIWIAGFSSGRPPLITTVPTTHRGTYIESSLSQDPGLVCRCNNVYDVCGTCELWVLVLAHVADGPLGHLHPTITSHHIP